MILPDSNLWQFPPKIKDISLFIAFVQYYYSQGYRQRADNGGQKLMLQGPLEQVVTICWWYKMLQDVTRLFRTSQVRPFFCLVRQYRLVLKSVWRESFHEWKWLDTGFFLQASWRESISRRITLVDCDVKEKSKTVFFNWFVSKMTNTMLTIFLLKTLKPFFWQVLDLWWKTRTLFQMLPWYLWSQVGNGKNHKALKTGIGYHRL